MEPDLTQDMSWMPSVIDKEIENFIIHIVQTIAGGDKIRLELVERIFEERTGFALSALTNQQTIAEGADGPSASTCKEEVLEYLKRMLSEGSALTVSCEDGCLSLRCDETVLDCSAESEKPLSLVVKDITTLDLSRRCFNSRLELLEVCKSAMMLKRLILRDIRILTCDEELIQGFPLIKLIKLYCPALQEVDITGCSEKTVNSLLESERSSAQDRGIYLPESTVKVVNLCWTNPELKQLLVPSHIPKDHSSIRDQIKALVQEGVPANVSCDGWCFLHTACAIGDADLVMWLLDNDGICKFESVPLNRPTSLEIAISCHHAPIVKRLLHVHQSDICDPCKLVELVFTDQCSALRIGHSNSCDPLEVVKLILDKRSLDFKTSFFVEITKAYQAVAPNELREKTCWSEVLLAELVKTLVSSGCQIDIPITDLGCKTPLMCAISSPVLIKTLLDIGANSSATDKEGNTALFYAASKAVIESTDEHLQTCLMLLDSNSDASALNRNGETPLLYALSSERLKDWDELRLGCNLKIWEVLVQFGADVTAVNKGRKSVMHLAIDRTRKLLEKISQSSHSLDRMSELSQIAVDQCIAAITFLSKRIENLVLFRDNEGNTPLHALAAQDSLELPDVISIARTLIDCGSKVHMVNDQEKTPLHLAKSWSMAKYLLENGAKPNVVDNEGCSPLILRCRETNPKQLQELENLSRWSEGVKCGMDPWHEDKKRKNVFTTLMDSCNVVNLKCFINASVDKERENVLETDSNGNTFLHYLCNCNDNTLKPLKDTLLQKGASVNAQNNNGDTPLHIVCRNIMRLPAHKAFNSAYWKSISPLLAYQPKLSLKNKKGDSVVNIVWCNKKVLAAVRRKVVSREPLPFASWIPLSQIHRGVLSQVARRQDCDIVDDYWYHRNPIGFGAFGNVYAAINVTDGREVALKRTETFRFRTRQDEREVQTLVQLSSCPQVVKYLGLMRRTDFTWIILELMEGNIDDLLHRTADTSCFPKLCKDVLLGVRFLHRNNIIHRDLKPSNVLYTYDDAKPLLKIADFGLSKNLSAGISQGSSVFHSNAGSRCWMAPELLSSPGPLQHTFESDVFACGLIVHYMLADRRHPFEGTTTDDRGSVGYSSAVEQSIKCGAIALSEDLTKEALDLLSQALRSSKDERPKASEVVGHPFFWSDYKKIQFLIAVANQSEVGTSGRHPRSSLETEIENNVLPMFGTSPWDTLFPAIYTEMTSSRRGRPYATSSGVHLLRFIRNAYAHVSDSRRPTGFQKDLLTDNIFLKKLPNLFMIVYKAVKSVKWDIRPEISSVINSDLI